MIEIVAEDLVPIELTQHLNEQAINQVTANIADGARNEWIRLAGQKLHRSKQDYINGIQAVDHKPGIAIITLTGQPANLIENGASQVDLRDWLLGPKVPVAPFGQKGKRQAKNGGFYRAIPFRHSIPNTSGAVGTPMDRPGGRPYGAPRAIAEAKAIGRAVYKQAQQLKKGQRLPAGLKYGRGKVVPKLRAHHKTDIYAGMIKLRGAYKKKIQSHYMTFRMISTNVTTGWIRPQTQGVELAKKTRDYIRKIAPQAFQAYIDSMGKRT